MTTGEIDVTPLDEYLTRVEPPKGREQEIHRDLNGSQGTVPSYEVVDGHRVSSFGEARMVSLEKLAEAERARATALQEDADAADAVTRAMKRRQETQQAVERTTNEVRLRQRQLATRIGIHLPDFTKSPDDRLVIS